ncbi:hypothetical protein SKAU_G00332840 [Synaphobranchus kaupii]|uniref:Uncharacterized protein n=1 Tax=Synaphobranchus kaupii TaxID=118154 RepID=A0A9Q1IGH1_SYNKA|nr:hypothetical protein SKAU_G00332840 [Synaphobranchus kaupii]
MATALPPDMTVLRNEGSSCGGERFSSGGVPGVMSPWLWGGTRACGLDMAVFLHPQQRGRYTVWLTRRGSPPLTLLSTDKARRPGIPSLPRWNRTPKCACRQPIRWIIIPNEKFITVPPPWLLFLTSQPSEKSPLYASFPAPEQALCVGLVTALFPYSLGS